LDLTVNLFILNIKTKRETQPRISNKAKHLNSTNFGCHSHRTMIIW